MRKKMENFIIKVETIKKYQVNTVEPRNTVTEIKKLIDGFNTGLDTAKKGELVELDVRAIKNIHIEVQREEQKNTDLYF